MKNLSVNKLAAQCCVKALTIAVFQEALWVDVNILCPNSSDPAASNFSYKLRTVVRTNECKQTAQDEQIRQGIDKVRGVQSAPHVNSQASAARLIRDIQRSKGSAIDDTAMHKIVGLNVVFKF